MKPVSKWAAGFVAAAFLVTSLAGPAEARRYGRWHHGHDNVDTGDVLAGLAIFGGLVAIASAANRNRAPRYERRAENPYRVVVNSCGSQADEAYGEGSVRVTHVEQVDRDYFRVTGQVNRSGGYYGREEPAWEPEAGYEPDPSYEAEAEDESSAVIGQERYYDAEAARRERENRAQQAERDRSFTFTCTALGDGRIVEFAANDY